MATYSKYGFKVGSPSSNESVTENELKIFNVLDYGAIPGDDLSDVAGIQAAIDAASAYVASRGKGKVVIPAGKYNIDDEIIFKSGVEIAIDMGAWFRPDDAYTGAIWSNGGAFVVNSYIHGGYYGDWGMAKGWNFIDIQSADGGTDYVVFSRFSNMYVENCNIAINIACSVTGWVNANTFDNFIIAYALEAIKTRNTGTGAGVDGNVFYNFQVQPEGDFVAGIDGLCGSDNHLTDIILWDVALMPPTAITCTVVYGADMNYLTGMNLLSQNYSDQGTNTTIISNGTITRSNNFNLFKRSTGGTEAVPVGDAGISFKSYWNTGTPTSNNWGTRILAQDMAASHFGSQLVFQTHGEADSETLNTVMTLRQDGLVVLPVALQLTPTASPPSNGTEGCIYMDTDHHLYVHNGTIWKQLDN